MVWCHDSFGDQAIEGPRTVEWNEPGHRLAVIGHGDLLPVADQFEVPAEMVTQFSDTCLHQESMALSATEFTPRRRSVLRGNLGVPSRSG